jgi:hypothetical protein
MTHCLNRVVLFKQKKLAQRFQMAHHNPLVSRQIMHSKGPAKLKSASIAHDTVSISRPTPPSPATAAVARRHSTAVGRRIYTNGAPTAKVRMPQCRDDLCTAVLWHLGRAAALWHLGRAIALWHLRR